MNDVVTTERRGRVLIVTLNRPERLNALTTDVYDALDAIWQSLHDDDGIRAIVITGAGDRGFCSGMDLKAAAERGAPRELEANVYDEVRISPMSWDVWLPTIVAVNGVCNGAGFHFLADADIILASNTASFLDTHVSVGQCTALEPISLMPRIGLGNALRMSVLGKHGRMDAEEALRIGLVDEVVDADRLLDRAVEVAEQCATGSPAAVEASKRAVWAALDRPYREAMQYGWEILLAHRRHPDTKEGPMAFAEKREPMWDRTWTP